MKIRSLSRLLPCLLGLALIAPATTAAELEATTRSRVIQSLGRVLEERYVFPEVGKRMADAVAMVESRGNFRALSDGEEFARRLTTELRTVSRDKHLRVRYHAEARKRSGSPGEPTPEDEAAARDWERRVNVGFEKVEVLPGNIGLLTLNFFGDETPGAERMAGAMRFLAGTDALIVDLRRNGGGNPAMVQVACSYFFPDAKTHLNSLYWREGNRTNEFWTLAELPAPRYLGRPVYVLTSGNTFSGAEEFAYNLQTRKRATIVGQTTGGGANPGRDEFLDEHFSVFVPNGRAINPVTGTNWEGVGVKPEVAVRSARALMTAHKLALEAVVPCYAKDAEWTDTLNRERSRLEGELSKTGAPVGFRLNGFADAKEVSLVGAFNDWTPGADKLTRDGDAWKTEAELEPGRHPYKFWVDGQWLVDPQNPQFDVAAGGHTNSVIIVPGR